MASMFLICWKHWSSILETAPKLDQNLKFRLSKWSQICSRVHVKLIICRENWTRQFILVSGLVLVWICDSSVVWRSPRGRPLLQKPDLCGFDTSLISLSNQKPFWFSFGRFGHPYPFRLSFFSWSFSLSLDPLVSPQRLWSSVGLTWTSVRLEPNAPLLNSELTTMIGVNSIHSSGRMRSRSLCSVRSGRDSRDTDPFRYPRTPRSRSLKPLAFPDLLGKTQDGQQHRQSRKKKVDAGIHTLTFRFKEVMYVCCISLTDHKRGLEHHRAFDINTWRIHGVRLHMW